MNNLKKLPIGIQDLSEIIHGGYAYVDKTEHVCRLVETGKYYFLSRPRRFGKSLFVDTLKQAFSGNRDLFRGLYLDDHWDWSVQYPVILISFGSGVVRDRQTLDARIADMLTNAEDEYAVKTSANTTAGRFAELIRRLRERAGQRVVVLVDEYDKPILDCLDRPEAAREVREGLKDLYSVLKDSDAHLAFVFLTGVSRFSRVSIFSGLNNLRDISLSDAYSGICGYLEDDIRTVFTGHVDALAQGLGCSRDEVLAAIQHWYNGYSWDGRVRVYNPASVLFLFAEGRFANYWFSTGTPSFLLERLRAAPIDLPQLERMEVNDATFEQVELDSPEVIPLMFQAGYLTVMERRQEPGPGIGRSVYYLGYPNQEVRESLLNHLFADFTGSEVSRVSSLISGLRESIVNRDAGRLSELLQGVFAGIPSRLRIERESYFHSLFYLVASLLGARVDLEVLTDKGRIDAALELEDRVVIIEFKLGSARSALAQMRDRRYHEKYLNCGKQVLLLGIGGFDQKRVECEFAEVQ